VDPEPPQEGTGHRGGDPAHRIVLGQPHAAMPGTHF
jgi:hypothetical protein